MPKCPNVCHPPILVRFLTTHWPLSSETIGSVPSRLQDLSSEQWGSFDRVRISADLADLIEAKGETARIKDCAQPVVLCVFGYGGDGKSTFANLIAKQGGVPKFDTDSFVRKLQNHWHDSVRLRELATLHVPHTIDQFIQKVQSDPVLGQDFVKLFFDPTHGFNLKAPLSTIEGYLRFVDPNAVVPDPAIRLEKEVVSELKRRGYKVWVAKTSNRVNL